MARLRGSDIVDSTLTGSDIQDGTVVKADLENMAQATVIGRASGAGTGVPVDLSAAQLQTIVGVSGTNTGDQTITLTGDVTGSGTGSFAATIANDAVTNAKLDNMATMTIKGNNTGGSSDPLDLTTAQVKTMLDLTGTNSGDQTITLTGEVTGSGTGSFATTIANDAVTYAKMQNVSAASKLLGRGDSGSGDVQEITLGTNLTMNGTTLDAAGGGGSGTATEHDVNQVGHGFVVGEIIYHTGAIYDEAKADAEATAEVLGIVSAVADADNFTFVSNGKITTLSGLTAGSTYFLSPSTAGAYTTTEPTTAGQVSKPVFIADSTTTAYVIHSRGAVVGGGTTAPLTEWVKGAFTWTFDGTTFSVGTISTRRVGDTLEVNGFIEPTAGTGTTMAINLPGGIVIDSTKYGGSIQRTVVGEWWAHNATTVTAYTTNNKFGAIYYDYGGSTSKLYFTMESSNGGTFNFTDASTIINTSSMGLTFKFSFPVVAYDF